MRQSTAGGPEVLVAQPVAVAFEGEDVGAVDVAVAHGCGDDVVAEAQAAKLGLEVALALGAFGRPGHDVTGDRSRGRSWMAPETMVGADFAHAIVDDHSRLAYVELDRLKRIRFGNSMTEQIAARCIRELARDIADLNQRIKTLDGEIAHLLSEHDNPLADLHGAGTNLTATIIAHAGDVRRFRNAAAFARVCGAAPIPCGSGQTAGRHRLHRGGNRQLNAALYRIAIVQQRHHPAAKAFLTRKIAEGKTDTKPAVP